MSRSALWRQEGNVKERERQAEELFALAVEEGRNNRAKNLVPLWGPDDSFQFNPMLLQNIVKSSYFQKCCRDITDWNLLVDEIYYQVKHLEPWAVGSSKEPSTAFCLLLRLLTLRCTEKQMKLLLDHMDSPYIRAIGFLYLRYAADPKIVFQWIEPYLYDEEPIQIQASSSKQKVSDTVGDFVRRLFTERNHFGTVLPRLPIQMEREIQVKLLQAEKIEERAKKNASDPQKMNYFKKLGSKVMALYGDEENPVTWYEAGVDRVITINEETSQPLRNPKFVVTFPEYGNTETVTLGELEMLGSALDPVHQPPRGGSSDRAHGSEHRGGDRRRDDRGYGNVDRIRGYDNDRGYSRPDEGGYKNRNGHGYSNPSGGRGHDDRQDRRDNDGGGHRDDQWQRGHGGRAQHAAALLSEGDLYQEVRRRERETVTSSSRNANSRRPPSTKTSLMGSSYDGNRRTESPPRARPRERTPRPAPSETAPAPKKRTAEDYAAVQEKKRKLMAKYG